VVDRLASWSPDGQWIIFSSDVRSDGNLDIYRMRPDGSDLQVVYSSAERKSHPRYSPDGRYIVFTSGDQTDARTWEILRYDLENGSVTRLTTNETRDASPLYSPDGNSILYITTVSDGGQAIAVMDANGDNPRVIYNSPGADWAASYSPDGRFIAFSSNMNGGDRVFLMTSDGRNVQQVTSLEGTYPSWLPGA
jgi:Tol biopolymer transport system component